MSETKLKGLWWIPGQPENQLSGEITYGPAIGAQLNLLGYFFKDSELEPFTVWGMTVTGKPVTLFDCRTKNYTVYVPGARVAEISSYFGVVGGHYRTPAEMKFAMVFVELSYLREWTGTSGITQKGSEKSWQVTHDLIPEISLGSHAQLKLAIEFTNHVSHGFGDCRLSEDCKLKIEASELTSYEVFEDVLHRLQHFIALGVSRPVYVLAASARVKEPKQVIHGIEIYEEFQIVRKLSRSDKQDSVRLYDLQFGLKDLQPEPAEFLKRYFANYKLLEPVCELFFSTLYNPEMYLPQRFLSLAHAIEAYHRAFVGGKYQTDDDYRNGIQKLFWEAIPKSVDRDFRASLKNKLRYLHEYSLRKRVRDICVKYVALLKPFLGEPTDFAGMIADQRNLLTHPDSTLEDRPEGIDLRKIWLMSEQLSLLIEVCLLGELGFDGDAIAKLLRRNRRIRAIQLNRK